MTSENKMRRLLYNSELDKFVEIDSKAKQPTPWGLASECHIFRSGVREVFINNRKGNRSGFIISKTFAKKNLSEAALAVGTEYGGYVCFEGTTESDIVLLELGSLVRVGPDSHVTDEQLINSLSKWHRDYVVARNLVPAGTQRTEPNEANSASVCVQQVESNV